jgi:hypothetical protein
MPIQIVYSSRTFSLKKLLRDPGTGKIFLRKETFGFLVGFETLSGVKQ